MTFIIDLRSFIGTVAKKPYLSKYGIFYAHPSGETIAIKKKEKLLQ